MLVELLVMAQLHLFEQIYSSSIIVVVEASVIQHIFLERDSNMEVIVEQLEHNMVNMVLF